MKNHARPSEVSEVNRPRWRAPVLALAVHALAVLPLAGLTLQPPKVEQAPVMVVEVVRFAAPAPEMVQPIQPVQAPVPPDPAPRPTAAKPLPKATRPAPAAPLKKAVPVVAPSPQPAPVSAPASAPAATEPAAPHQATGPANSVAPAAEEAFVPPSSQVAGLNNPKPPYPGLARKRGWEGVVTLLVEVDSHGRANAVSVKQSSGHPILDRCAEHTVAGWRFVPARRGGQSVAASIEVPIRFSLTEEDVG